MATFDEIRAAATASPRETVARILLRNDLAERHAELDAELQALMASHRDEINSPEVQSKAAEVTAMEAEIEDSLTEFKFRAVSSRAWRVLMAEHPPTKAQREQNAQVSFDQDTFWPAAIAASCVDPVLTVDQAVELELVLTSDQWDALAATCLTVNRAGEVGKSWAAGLIHRTNGASAKRPTTSKSRGRSSSGNGS